MRKVLLQNAAAFLLQLEKQLTLFTTRILVGSVTAGAVEGGIRVQSVTFLPKGQKQPNLAQI